MNLKPLDDRIVVERDQAPKTSAGGIELPSADEPESGVVVAVGPGRFQDGVRVKPALFVGNAILFGKYSGQVVRYNGKEYVAMRESDVIAVVA